jgi:hypothetical protein
LDAEKHKKLQQYAAILADQAKEAERTGKPEDAIKHYLKLVDVFLVLASEAQDHNTWLQYIRQAEAYQTRIKSLVPNQFVAPDISGRIPPPPDEKPAPAPSTLRREAPPPENTSLTQQGNPAKSGAFNKILKPFQRSDLEDPGAAATNLVQTKVQPAPLLQPRPQVNTQPASQSQFSPNPTVTRPEDNKGPVPHELYERSLSENRILHERLQAIVKETDEKIAFLESRTRELEERIALMVPKIDYEALRAEFQNTVPKHEYDRLKSELAGTVPITHYDQLLDRISGMVPRDLYVASEKRVLELEDLLRRSVPFTEIDELANEVSFMSIVAEVPPMIGEGVKEEEEPVEIVSTDSGKK